MCLGDGTDATKTEALEFLLQHVAPSNDVLSALLLLEPLADLFPRVACADNRQPVATWAVRRLGSQDFNDIAILEFVVKRNQFLVHARTDAPVSDIGMDPVGEIQRCGPRRQVLDLTAWGKDKDLILEDVHLDGLDELLRRREFLLPRHELAQPRKFRLELRIRLTAFLVAPVRRNPVFGDPMHIVRADLHLEESASARDHGRVQRLIHVALWHRDVIVELSWNRGPEAVNNSKRRIALRDRGYHNPEGKQVVQLVEAPPRPLHLLVNGVDVLGTPCNLGGDPGLRQVVAYGLDALLDVRLSCPTRVVQEALQLLIVLRFEVIERSILKLPLDLPDAKTMRQRSVDLECLPGDTVTCVGALTVQSAHIVQSIAQLD